MNTLTTQGSANYNLNYSYQVYHKTTVFGRIHLIALRFWKGFTMIEARHIEFVENLIDLMREYSVSISIVGDESECFMDIDYDKGGYVETETAYLTPEVLESLISSKTKHSCN